MMKPNLTESVDISEKGFSQKGEPMKSDKRLFVQLLVFTGSEDSSAIINELKESKFEGVLYEDINDPRGIGLLTFAENPDFFISKLRPFLNKGKFSRLIFKPEYTMTGRTYSLGHERNLEDWLLERPKRVSLDPDHSWAIWYPLRRTGAFALLPHEEQMQILMEHGTIGRAFGQAGLAHDVRLACHGVNENDNDFVIGLIGKDLFPLSAIVQAMRKTKQTSTYIDKMGPFFVGKAIWKSEP